MTNIKFDLKERTFEFSQSLISFCSTVPKNPINNPLRSQLVRAGTSIGANYAEANEASSKKDFIYKLSIAHKEISETRYWLQLMVDIIPEEKKALLQNLAKEIQELNLIFATIIKKSKENPGS